MPILAGMLFYSLTRNYSANSLFGEMINSHVASEQCILIDRAYYLVYAFVQFLPTISRRIDAHLHSHVGEFLEPAFHDPEYSFDWV